MARQHRAERATTVGVDRGAGRVLAPRRRDHRPRSSAQSSVEPIRIEPLPVDGTGSIASPSACTRSAIRGQLGSSTTPGRRA